MLRLFADGGGALIRFAGIYSRVAGGNLVLDYSGPVGGAGSRRRRDARFPPARTRRRSSRRIKPRSARRATELTRITQTQTPNDLNFTQLRIPFRQEGWVITIADAALRGASLGATASGTINIPGGKMAISGALIPAFGLNNIAGAIPLLGALLGGRNEGLFGITYQLFGPLDEPAAHDEPDLGARAGHLPQDLRVPSVERQPGTTSACFFRPIESFTTPSALMSPSLIDALRVGHAARR